MSPGRAGPVFRHDRTTRMIPDLKDLPYEQRLAKTKLWSLEDRWTRADLIEVYKITIILAVDRRSTFNQPEITSGRSAIYNKDLQ